jgi:hypothetical protein
VSAPRTRTKIVKAKRVREGDFLPGLDDGYVFTEPVESRRGEGYVEIGFHDVDGNENFLDVSTDLLITVERKQTN